MLEVILGFVFIVEKSDIIRGNVISCRRDKERVVGMLVDLFRVRDRL